MFTTMIRYYQQHNCSHCWPTHMSSSQWREAAQDTSMHMLGLIDQLNAGTTVYRSCRRILDQPAVCVNNMLGWMRLYCCASDLASRSKQFF